MQSYMVYFVLTIICKVNAYILVQLGNECVFFLDEVDVADNECTRLSHSSLS